MTMDERYVKTEAGRAELKERRLALPRQARLLLVIIDATKTGAEWIAAVNGSSDADIERLVSTGLIAARSSAVRPDAATSPLPAGRPPEAGPLVEREPTRPSANMPALSDAAMGELIQSMGYRQLYDLLTSQARPRLGLISGYRMVLEVERCNGVADLRALALRFVESARQAQGAEGVRQFCVELRAVAPQPA
jgi:hypothetical protein